MTPLDSNREGEIELHQPSAPPQVYTVQTVCVLGHARNSHYLLTRTLVAFATRVCVVVERVGQGAQE